VTWQLAQRNVAAVALLQVGQLLSLQALMLTVGKTWASSGQTNLNFKLKLGVTGSVSLENIRKGAHRTTSAT
jgi:hypothetical protein